MILGLNSPTYGLDHSLGIRFTGTKWVRQVLLWRSEMDLVLENYRGRGISVLGVLARESMESFGGAGWFEAYANRFCHSLGALQIWNEPDGPHGGTSAPISMMDLNGYIKRTIRAVREPFPHCKIIGPGLITGQPSYLREMNTASLDAIAVHPYWKLGADMGWFLDNHWDISHKPIWITEVDLRQDAVLALRRHSRVDACFIYCWQRWPGWPLALVDERGTPLPLWHEYKRVQEALMAEDLEALKARIDLLEKQQQFTWDEFARILAGQWHEGAGSAEALLRAVAPKYASFEAVKFPLE